MKYKLLIRKLNYTEEKIMTSKEIKKYCEILKIEYLSAIKYLTRHRHLKTIMKGIFYNYSVTERKLNIMEMTPENIMAKTMKIKGIDNWYFALETSIKFHNLTHEYFAKEFIITDKITRKKLELFGKKFEIKKIKPELFDFGIIKEKNLKYSDVEKTLIDIIYLKRYEGIDDSTLANYINPLLEHCSKNKLIKYAKKYNKKTEEFVKKL